MARTASIPPPRASAIAHAAAWSSAEKRLLPVFALALAAWLAQPWLEPLLPKNGFTDGTIAAAAGMALFVLPDGTGRPMLVWSEANRAPWDVVLMFGGGLAMAMGMTESGLANWIGQMLLPLGGVPLPIVALVLVAVVILFTEFASNIAVASGIMPVVAALVGCHRRRSAAARAPGRGRRHLGLHAAIGHRPQCDRLGDRPHRPAAGAEGRACCSMWRACS